MKAELPSLNQTDLLGVLPKQLDKLIIEAMQNNQFHIVIILKGLIDSRY